MSETNQKLHKHYVFSGTILDPQHSFGGNSGQTVWPTGKEKFPGRIVVPICIIGQRMSIIFGTVIVTVGSIRSMKVPVITPLEHVIWDSNPSGSLTRVHPSASSVKTAKACPPAPLQELLSIPLVSSWEREQQHRSKSREPSQITWLQGLPPDPMLNAASLWGRPDVKVSWQSPETAVFFYSLVKWSLSLTGNVAQSNTFAMRHMTFAFRPMKSSI